MHIARGMFYGSYRSPRTLVWTIGVIILIVMMATMWPNWKYENINIDFIFSEIILNSKVLPINKSRTKAILRIGPHNKDILDIIICGMLGDFWADKIQGKQLNSVRFNIEQSISNTAYIHNLTLLLYKGGYCSRPVPTLVQKSDPIIENRFNYRLTLFTFTSFNWIYDSFYINVNGKTVKKVPFFIAD